MRHNPPCSKQLFIGKFVKLNLLIFKLFCLHLNVGFLIWEIFRGIPHSSSSDQGSFDIFWSIKLKPRPCTSLIYTLSLCGDSEPKHKGFIQKWCGQSVIQISQIHLSSDTRNFDIFGRSKWNHDLAHLPYIFFHCVEFENPRTMASYKSAADNVLYKYR